MVKYNIVNESIGDNIINAMGKSIIPLYTINGIMILIRGIQSILRTNGSKQQVVSKSRKLLDKIKRSSKLMRLLKYNYGIKELENEIRIIESMSEEEFRRYNRKRRIFSILGHIAALLATVAAGYYGHKQYKDWKSYN